VLLLFCSEFASEPVHSGSGLAQDYADIVYDDLWSLNLDNTAVESYQVLLSRLDASKPNFVRVFYTEKVNQVVSAEGYNISDHRGHYNFAAYSPSANITVRNCTKLELEHSSYTTRQPPTEAQCSDAKMVK